MIRGGVVRLPVADVSHAVRFYVETLGMKLVAERPGDAVIDAGDGLLLELAQTPGGEHKGAVAVGLRPKIPLAEARAILENRGIVFDASHRFADPDDNALFLVAP